MNLQQKIIKPKIGLLELDSVVTRRNMYYSSDYYNV